MTAPHVETSPVTFPVHVAKLPKSGMQVKIEADEQQRSALAAAHELQAVERFVARLDVSTWKKGGVRVVGSVQASVVQQCVVTLEPVTGSIDEVVSVTLLPEGSRLAVPNYSAEGEILLDPEGDDSPETFSGETVDVGQIAEEFFALGIDPYPRKQGATLDLDGNDDEKRGPLYDKLAALRAKF